MMRAYAEDSYHCIRNNLTRTSPKSASETIPDRSKNPIRTTEGSRATSDDGNGFKLRIYEGLHTYLTVQRIRSQRRNACEQIHCAVLSIGFDLRNDEGLRRRHFITAVIRNVIWTSQLMEVSVLINAIQQSESLCKDEGRACRRQWHAALQPFDWRLCEWIKAYIGHITVGEQAKTILHILCLLFIAYCWMSLCDHPIATERREKLYHQKHHLDIGRWASR